MVAIFPAAAPASFAAPAAPPAAMLAAGITALDMPPAVLLRLIDAAPLKNEPAMPGSMKLIAPKIREPPAIER